MLSGGDDSSIEKAFREEWGRVVAALARAFGDLDIAEEATAEAFAEATRSWPEQGTPTNPGAWLNTTARRRAIDRLGRQMRQRDLHSALAPLVGMQAEPELPGSVDDDLLALIFMCAHPALSSEAQMALSLRMVMGLSTVEVAGAMLVPEATLAQRIVRAKRKIRDTNLKMRMPAASELPDRLAVVLAVVQLVFSEGYVATATDGLDRPDLCAEAIWLTRLLARLMPDEIEVRGLLANMLLTQARRRARVDNKGSFVSLREQDRDLWDQTLIDEGRELLQRCRSLNRPGPHQIHAAINAVHTQAESHEATDWQQIVALYDMLSEISPTPVVALNRAVAVAEVHGPWAGLSLVEELSLRSYHLWHATRADLLQRCGRHHEAREAFQLAADLTSNGAEAAYLLGRIEASRAKAPSR